MRNTGFTARAGSGGFARGRGFQTFTPHTPSPIRTGNVNVPSFITQTSGPFAPGSGSSPLNPNFGCGSGSGGNSSELIIYQHPDTSTPMGMGTRQGTVSATGSGAGSNKMSGNVSATSTPFQPLGSTHSGSALALKKDETITTQNDPDTSPEADNTDTNSKSPTLTLTQATQLLQLTIAHDNSELTPLSIPIALYSPLGSFLPPLQPLLLTPTTTLRVLVLKLQELLLKNLRHSGSLARLLVQSVQIRGLDLILTDLNLKGWESLEWLKDFGEKKQMLILPRVEGLLSGEEEVGEMEGVVGKTTWVAWDGRGGGEEGEIESESEMFWEALVKKLLFDAANREEKEVEERGRAPMLKGRTVVKVGDVSDGDMVMNEKVEGGGHLFRVPDGAILPAMGVVVEDLITPRGSLAAQGGQGPPKKETDKAEAKDEKGKAKENRAKEDKRDNDIDIEDKAPAQAQANTQRHHRGVSDSAENLFAPSTSASASASEASLQTALNRKFYRHHKATQRSRDLRKSLYMAPAADDDKMAAAEDLLEQLNIDDRAKEMEEEMLKKVEAESGASESDMLAEKAHYERLMGASASQQVWVQNGGYPKDAPYDEDFNWDTYVGWGEKPTDPGYENRQALHKAFSLKHIPFNGPPCEPWTEKGEQIGPEGDGDDDEDEEKIEKEKTPMKMVPFAVIDAKEVEQKLLEERNKPENLPPHIKKYWEEQEKIKGMDEEDDDTFFPAGNPDVIKRQEAGKVFAAKEYKNPDRQKNFDFISKLQGSTQRRAVSNSAYLNSLAADGPSNLYDNLPITGPFQFAPTTTFNRSHAAADNTFTSTLQNVPSFSALAKQDYKSVSPGPGFYELSAGVMAHRPASEPDSFVSDLPVEDIQGDDAGESNEQQATGIQFGDFKPGVFNYTGKRDTARYGGFSTMTNEQQGDGYTTMGGTSMQQNMMGGDNSMGGSNMGGNDMENNMMGGSMMGGSNNQTHTSFDLFGSTAGGRSDLRGIVTHGFLAAPNMPSSGWTHMNTGGATYNSFGGQSSSFKSRTTSNSPQSRATGSGGWHYTGSSAYHTPTSQGLMQSRFFNSADNPRPTPGNERYAFNNMAVPHNPTQSGTGSFTSPMTTPTHQNQPAAGSFVHGSGRSRTHGLYVGSNPTAASRARRAAAIPIVAPPGRVSVPGFQFPSPTRQAIGYGASVDSSAPLTMGSPGNVRGTPSPDKKAKDAFTAAIAKAFNGPEGSPAGGK